MSGLFSILKDVRSLQELQIHLDQENPTLGRELARLINVSDTVQRFGVKRPENGSVVIPHTSSTLPPSSAPTKKELDKKI